MDGTSLPPGARPDVIPEGVEVDLVKPPQHDYQLSAKFQNQNSCNLTHITIGSPLPQESQQTLTLASNSDTQFWYQLPDKRHPFVGHPETLLQSSHSPLCSDRPSSQPRRHRPASLPTPPPEPKHSYRHNSPPPSLVTAAPLHDFTSSSCTCNFSYNPYLAGRMSTGNGWFLNSLPLHSATHVAETLTSYFIPYQTFGFLEVTSDLINRICPGDLCHKPCPYDALFTWDDAASSWVTGCPMLRLCECVHGHTKQSPHPLPLPVYRVDYHDTGMSASQLRGRIFKGSTSKRPPAPLSAVSEYPVDHPKHEKSCPFIHGIGMTCNKLKQSVRRREVLCEHVLKAVTGCVYGHDFEQERLAAYERLVGHKREAEAYRIEGEGAAVVWRNEKGGWIGLR